MDGQGKRVPRLVSHFGSWLVAVYPAEPRFGPHRRPSMVALKFNIVSEETVGVALVVAEIVISTAPPCCKLLKTSRNSAVLFSLKDSARL